MHTMVRRTKEEAEQTRGLILAAARRCFHARGVSATSLEHIAQEAGVTRGAIYWHFANKEELFKAMCDEVELPLIDRTDFTLLQDKATEPLQRLRNFMVELAEAVLQASPLRQTVEILNYKCEFVGPMGHGLDQHLAELREFREKLQRVPWPRPAWPSPDPASGLSSNSSLVKPSSRPLAMARPEAAQGNARLAALVPPPRLNLTRFHGVFAPNSPYRARITPARRGRGGKPRRPQPLEDRTPAEQRSAMRWAKRLKRVFRIDVETCPKCGGTVQIIASIEDPPVIERILNHLAKNDLPGLWPDSRAPPGTGRPAERPGLHH